LNVERSLLLLLLMLEAQKARKESRGEISSHIRRLAGTNNKLLLGFQKHLPFLNDLRRLPKVVLSKKKLKT